MKKKILAVGIDVAKSSLSICLHYSDESEKILNIGNIDTDINQKLLPMLKDFKGRIVMESTGHYHWTPALILSENNYDVYVVNPLLAKQYLSTNIRKVKSDPADASALARMARVADNLPVSFQKSPETLWIRKKLGLLSSFSKQLQALKANLKSVEEARGIVKLNPSPVIEKIKESIRVLEKEMKALEKECVEEMKKNDSLKEKINLLTSIPGISEFAATLCLYWFDSSHGQTVSSWVAYAGLDVSVRESGTWRGRCKLTKRGNNFLRKRLYCCAWGAWRNDSHFERYYLKLKEEGREHKEILTIMARKLIRISYMVLKSGKVYNPELCFKE